MVRSEGKVIRTQHSDHSVSVRLKASHLLPARHHTDSRWPCARGLTSGISHAERVGAIPELHSSELRLFLQQTGCSGSYWPVPGTLESNLCGHLVLLVLPHASLACDVSLPGVQLSYTRDHTCFFQAFLELGMPTKEERRDSANSINFATACLAGVTEASQCSTAPG